ncbi:glycosyltransferase family 4 protein [Pseudoroseomonas wenyumeiae]
MERRPGQITCMFLANHTPNKGLPQLLEAITRLQRPCLLIVGGERRDTIDYERYLRACGPGQEIIITGRVGDDDVAAMFRRSDLFVFPTLADTFPLVVLEAMSHGRPVLATRVGGIPHQVDESCGALVEPDHPAQLAAVIDRLGADPAHLRRLGRMRARASPRIHLGLCGRAGDGWLLPRAGNDAREASRPAQGGGAGRCGLARSCTAAPGPWLTRWWSAAAPSSSISCWRASFRPRNTVSSPYCWAAC